MSLNKASQITQLCYRMLQSAAVRLLLTSKPTILLQQVCCRNFFGGRGGNIENVNQVQEVQCGVAVEYDNSDIVWRQDLDHIAELVDSAQSVVVMAGAGLSTASGIPDFRCSTLYHCDSAIQSRRSPDTGIYSNLQKYNLPYPEAIFDIEYFRSGRILSFSLAVL